MQWIHDRQLEIGMPTDDMYLEIGDENYAMAELDQHLDGIALRYIKPQSELSCYLRASRQERDGLIEEIGLLTRLRPVFGRYFDNRGMSMDWDTMVERYAKLDKNTRDNMSAVKMLQLLLPLGKAGKEAPCSV
jgi:hypothetical protein